jgi:somatostatin receptor 2
LTTFFLKRFFQVTRLVLTVVAVYVCCWLPYWLTQLALLNSDHPQTPLVVTIYTFAAALAYSNSAMNPILYAFLSDNFKKSFTKACRCQVRCMMLVS